MKKERKKNKKGKVKKRKGTELFLSRSFPPGSLPGLPRSNQPPLLFLLHRVLVSQLVALRRLPFTNLAGPPHFAPVRRSDVDLKHSTRHQAALHRTSTAARSRTTPPPPADDTPLRQPPNSRRVSSVPVNRQSQYQPPFISQFNCVLISPTSPANLEFITFAVPATGVRPRAPHPPLPHSPTSILNAAVARAVTDPDRSGRILGSPAPPRRLLSPILTD